MRNALIISLLALTAAGTAIAKPASTLQDLVGARGSSGEMQLSQRGFVAGKSTTAQGGRVVFLGNQSDGTCVKILTKNGRYAWIKDAPRASCGLKGGSSAKVSLDGVMGISGVAAFDVMQAKGFAGVDTSQPGNGDLVSIYFNRATRQCVQVITSNNKVVAVSDIQTHPKCK